MFNCTSFFSVFRSFVWSLHVVYSVPLEKNSKVWMIKIGPWKVYKHVMNHYLQKQTCNKDEVCIN